MTSPSEQLAKAKAAKAADPNYQDVEVLLDAGLSRRREELEQQIKAAVHAAAQDQRLTSVNTAVEELKTELDTVLDEASSSIATLRFTELDSLEWGDISARCPVRLGVDIDQHYGYNMQAATVMAAPKCGGWLVDGEVVPLVVKNASDGQPAVDEWADLFATISGGDFASIQDAIFNLNVYGPSLAKAELKKALATRPA